MRIQNVTKQTLLADQAKVANSFLERTVGLLNRASLLKGEALMIRSCQGIHMFFMRFAIDAIFVDKKSQVVGLIENIKPFRLSPIFFDARDVIELPTGIIQNSKTQIGDQIEVSD